MSRQRASRTTMSAAPDIHVMMNGLPGAMGYEVAAACLRKGFKLAPYSLTGPNIDESEVEVDDLEGGEKTKVKLIKGDADPSLIDSTIQEMKDKFGDGLVVIDYTHPTAVNSNAEIYCRNGLNFVMGTTGGDREKLLEDTKESKVYAVIAPNMGKQIVALQTAIDYMAREFPGSFSGYKLTVTESHQATKADTSGTAKTLSADLATLTGAPFDVEEIVRIRTKPKQLEFGPTLQVEESALSGHAFHTYSLVSPDGSAEFQFRHNVSGRRMYADGTADAVEFLVNEVKRPGSSGKVFSMIDVLKIGGI
ncbi:unnamed protein product [Chrysoparadoxa australica]